PAPTEHPDRAPTPNTSAAAAGTNLLVRENMIYPSTEVFLAAVIDAAAPGPMLPKQAVAPATGA
ncbi:hypothetical protein, partial [Arthrobacter sp. JCM 19049]|uniref:hypothetical protein n=1 Tax=Arthrobacter sp. JCM 19049 TaxID=1460643 RepID=UPI000A462DFF